MTDAEVIRERLRALKSYVEVLSSFGNTTREDLEQNYERRWAILHGLQLAIECVQDISAHLVASRGLGTATNHTNAIDLLGAAGALEPDLASRIRGMPVVHEYLKADDARILEFLSRLEDFDAFSEAVVSFLGKTISPFPQ